MKPLLQSEAPTYRRPVFLLGCVLVLFIARAVAASLIIPPWQGPDEPAHFLWPKLLADSDPSEPQREALEALVLRSMAEHQWWGFYGEPTPDPLPVLFAEVPAHLASGSMLHPAYYWVGAAALRLVRSDGSIDADYAALRMLSMVLSAIALVCAWLGTRLLFGDTVALGATAMCALHPQFLLSAVSVNPDVLINLAGAFVWWQAARLYRVPHVNRPFVALLIVGAALVAAMAKRNGIPLVVVAGLVVMFGVGRRGAIALAIVIVGGAVLTWARWDSVDQAVSRYLTNWSSVFVARRTVKWESAAEITTFLRIAIDTAGLAPGWLTIRVPEAWLWFARFLTVLGLAGSLVHYKRVTAQTRRWLLLAWLFVLIQVIPILILTFFSRATPQGRYIFGALAPAALLIWLGLQQWVPARARPAAVPALLLVATVLDATSFCIVLVPTYVI